MPKLADAIRLNANTPQCCPVCALLVQALSKAEHCIVDSTMETRGPCSPHLLAPLRTRAKIVRTTAWYLLFTIVFFFSRVALHRAQLTQRVSPPYAPQLLKLGGGWARVLSCCCCVIELSSTSEKAFTVRA